jgi:hypothetical protein
VVWASILTSAVIPASAFARGKRNRASDASHQRGQKEINDMNTIDVAASADDGKPVHPTAFELAMEAAAKDSFFMPLFGEYAEDLCPDFIEYAYPNCPTTVGVQMALIQEHLIQLRNERVSNVGFLHSFAERFAGNDLIIKEMLFSFKHHMDLIEWLLTQTEEYGRYEPAA